ncbi:MAG: acyl-CoA dehydrogenase family protein [Chloroflexota bacterium]
MDFELTPEQRLWRETVHEFCAREVRPFAAEMDARAEFNAAAVRKMAPLGLLGLNIPEEFGGAGVDAVSAAIAIEELGWACGGTALSIAAHNGLGCAPIALFGSTEQKQRWLPGLARGEPGLGALALTEPEAGSDLHAIRTRAEFQGDEWVIHGNKAWITNPSIASLIVTLCRTSPDPTSPAFSLIVVPTGAPGLHIHPPEKKMGVRASPTHALTYENVRVPRDHVLGEPGQGMRQTLQVLDGGRVGIGALAIGLAQAALEEAIRYAKERHAFGKPLAMHQAIQWMIADAATQIDAARLLVRRAAWLKDRGQFFNKEAAVAKLFATEMAERVCRDAIQILGSYGYSSEYPVERLYRDARLMTIGEGTSEVQRMVIARRVLGIG